MSVCRCPACNEEFSVVEDALNHVNSSHAKCYKGCVFLGCSYKKNDKLSLHTRRKHRSWCKHHCRSCKRVFVRSEDMARHAKDVHGSGTLFVSSYTTPSISYHTFPSVSLSLTAVDTRLYHATALSRMSIANNSEGFDLNSSTTEDALNRFIDNKLQPDQNFNNEMNATVDDIVRFFQSTMSPREIVKGGSMGKGTAIRGNADIDLLLILPESQVNCASDLENKLPDIKNEIETYLRNKQNSRDFIVSPGTIRTTTFLVQFTVQRGSEEIKVDLLPTFNFTDKEILYKQMKEGPKNLLPYYSAALAKLQVAFVGPRPANVKNLIRLVKYWRKEYFSSEVTAAGSRIPTSYVLELITIHLWERKNRPNRFNTLKAFHSVMQVLANTSSIRAIWNENYNVYTIPDDVLHQRPLVMDPANPMNNVCHTFNWEQVEMKAQEALRSPMLRDISSDTW